jgi:hypothetical protein
MATPTAPHIVEGINLLNQRLLPAKLNQTSPVNSALLFQWLRDLGLNPMNMSAKSLADNLEGQIRKHVMERKLVWEVEPKILRQHLVERIKTDKEYENERTQQRDAIDAAVAKSKEDAATLQRINGMIESVRITSMGRDQYAKTDEDSPGCESGATSWRRPRLRSQQSSPESAPRSTRFTRRMRTLSRIRNRGNREGRSDERQ